MGQKLRTVKSSGPSAMKGAAPNLHLMHPAKCLSAHCLVPLQAAPRTCRLSPTAPATPALRAMTLLTGFINAESAVMGLFMGVMGEAMSTMTTLQHSKV